MVCHLMLVNKKAGMPEKACMPDNVGTPDNDNTFYNYYILAVNICLTTIIYIKSIMQQIFLTLDYKRF